MLKKLSLALILQSISPTLQFIIGILIARIWGVDTQGYFASKKAFLDLLTVLASFGFPQSIVLAVNRDGASRVRLYQDTWLYGFALFPLLVLINVLLERGVSGFFLEAISLSLASSAIVFSNLLRALLLTVDDGFRFHLITSVPAIGIVLSVLTVLGLSQHNFETRIAYAFALASAPIVCFTLLIFPPKLIKGYSGNLPRYSRLLLEGFDVFLQSVLLSVQVYLALRWVGQSTGFFQAGYVSIGLMFFQALLLPLQMIAPLLFNLWSRTAPPATAVLMAKLPRGSLLLLALGFAAVVASSSWWLPLMFGEGVRPGVLAVQIFLMAVLPAILARFASLYFMALRNLRANIWLTGLRLGVFVVVLLMLGLFQGITALSVASAWLVSELVIVAVYWWWMFAGRYATGGLR